MRTALAEERTHRKKGRRIDPVILLFHAVFIIMMIAVILPLILLLSISLSNEYDVVTKGYSFLPRNFTTKAYRWIFSGRSNLGRAYMVSIIVTSVGVVLGTTFMSMAGYVLSRRDYAWAGFFAMYFLFSILFRGGLVPTFVIVTRVFRLYDTMLVLILLHLIRAWFIFLFRGYMRTIPMDVIESAKIDGASEMRIYASIIVPMSKAALATVALLLTLSYWNDWFVARVYIETPTKVPLQFWMMRVMQNVQYLLNADPSMIAGANLAELIAELPNESARMAMAVLAAGPVLFIFPFFQRHFVKGIRIGSIKG